MEHVLWSCSQNTNTSAGIEHVVFQGYELTGYENLLTPNLASKTWHSEGDAEMQYYMSKKDKMPLDAVIQTGLQCVSETFGYEEVTENWHNASCSITM